MIIQELFITNGGLGSVLECDNHTSTRKYEHYNYIRISKSEITLRGVGHMLNHWS